VVDYLKGLPPFFPGQTQLLERLQEIEIVSEQRIEEVFGSIHPEEVGFWIVQLHGVT